MKKDKIIDIVLVIFGLFLIYQFLRIIFGGSWQVDTFFGGVLLLIISIVWRNSVKLEGHFVYHKAIDKK